MCILRARNCSPENFDPDYDDSFTNTEGETFHWVGDEWLCEHCCFYCDYHQRWERGDGTTVSGGDIVCSDAISEEYFWCELCCEYHPNSEESERSNICQDCFDENFYVCEHCGEIVELGDACVCQNPDYGKIEKKEIYSENDYVVIGTDLRKTEDLCGLTVEMANTPGIIGKVVGANETRTKVCVGTWCSWTYANEDIVGAIKVHKKSNLYNKYEEVFGHEPEVAE